MCWAKSSKTLSWLGVLWGLLALATLLIAFLSNVWLYTKEPIRFPNNDILTTVTFKIGLWRICPSFKHTNTTRNMPNPPCTAIKYSSWEDITSSDLGISFPLEFTPPFLSKMRVSTPFGAASMALIFFATVFALSGLYNSDQKTIVACGLYMLSGLTIGGGLLIFASVLSDAYFEHPRRSQVVGGDFEKVSSSNLFEYKYGWSFFAAGAAFIMSEMAAVLSISAYMRRFPTVEDMVKVIVPGAERRLKERHGLAGEYLVKHQSKYQRQDPDTATSMTSGLSSKFKSETLKPSELEGVDGPLLLTKPAPDICTSNPAVVPEGVISFVSPTATSSNIITAEDGTYCLKSEPLYILDDSTAVATDSNLTGSSLAGHTVPIVIMHQAQKSARTPFTFSSSPIEAKKNYKASVLLESKHNLTTLPSKHFHSCNADVTSLNHNLLSNHFNDFEDCLGEVQRFDLGLSHLGSELDSNTGAIFGSCYADDPYIQSSILGPALDLPGASSTTSSSSFGTGSGNTMTTGSSGSSVSRKTLSNFEKKKKKSVTIGNVFSTMNTFESDKTDNDSCDCVSGV